MTPPELLDALVFAGLLFVLGCAQCISGKEEEQERTGLGRLVALSGLSLAAVAIDGWHRSYWGTVTAFVLLVLGGMNWWASCRAGSALPENVTPLPVVDLQDRENSRGSTAIESPEALS